MSSTFAVRPFLWRRQACCRRSVAVGAFTLIELLVVVSIFAVLASMLLPALASARERSKRTACLGQQRQVLMAATLYADDADSNLPPSMAQYKNRAEWHYPSFVNFQTHTLDVQYGKGRMINIMGNYLPPELLICPAGANQPVPAFVKEYRSATVEHLMGGYSLFWNWGGATPTFKPSARLGDNGNETLITDVANYWNGTGGMHWNFAHRTNVGASAVDLSATGLLGLNSASQQVYNLPIALGNKAPAGIELNAGYRDGHADRLNSREWRAVQGVSGSFLQGLGRYILVPR